MNAVVSEWLTNHPLIKYTCTRDRMMITKDSINDLNVETNSPIANNHQRRMTTVRRMYLLIIRTTVAIQMRSVIGKNETIGHWLGTMDPSQTTMKATVLGIQ